MTAEQPIQNEAAAIAAQPLPFTVVSLAADLRALGLPEGGVVLVHSSMKGLGGWVCGGAEAVVLALLGALGPHGTLMAPAHSANNSDPAHWGNPPVPEVWWPVIREQMPAFNPATSSTRKMGAIADCVRTWTGAIRSDHPQVSFAALGPAADALAGAPTPLDQGTADGGPLGRLLDHDGHILLLGVGHGNNTTLHLAEDRAQVRHDDSTYRDTGAAMLVDGERQWVTWRERDYDDGDFAACGAAYEAANPGAVTVGTVGAGTARLMRARPLVAWAEGWLAQTRGYAGA